MQASGELRAKLDHLPNAPGVYLMKDAAGDVLYVGKAKSLRPRVRSYFNATQGASLKTRELVRRIADIDTIVVNSEAEALILENNLIKEFRPRFNINLRDDKTYPYIKITVQEPFPRIMVTRRLQKDGARYFGPYTDVRRMRHALGVVKRLYTVRSCHYQLPREAPARPCLDYHIGRCKAPCVALQSEQDYRAMIGEIEEILGGQPAGAAGRLREEMAGAAANLDFERAAELRDSIEQLEALESKQKVADVEGSDRDVVAMARHEDEACGVVLRVREGKLLGREAVFVSNVREEPDEAVMASLAASLYVSGGESGHGIVPSEVLFSIDFADRPLVETVLRERAGRRVATRVPQRGDKVRLVALAEQNARHLLTERRNLERHGDLAPDTLFELQEALGLASQPRAIVCFDVSHTQGSETVASAVTFQDGKPDKSGYRRFRIKGAWGNDDFRSMHEAVSRFFRRRTEEGKPLPDLVVIDGGKGQLGAARQALADVGSPHQPVVSLAKRDEEVFLPGRADPLRLPRTSPALRILQRMRDEAHRFAVTYNRNLRTRRTVRSELSSVPGIGAARQKRLLDRFGSVRGIATASEAEIAALPGFGTALAKTVRDHARALSTSSKPAGGREAKR